MPIISGGKSGGLPLTGGTLTGPLLIQTTDPNVVPLTVKMGLAAQNVDGLAVVNADDSTNIAAVGDSGHLTVGHGTSVVDMLGGSLGVTTAGAGNFQAGSGPIKTRQAAVIAGGALSSIAFVSGTEQQIDANYDRQLTVPITYNPTAIAVASCTVALSPDDTTFTTMAIITRPVGTVFDGSIDPVDIYVPAAWWVKLTVVNATIGTGHYF